MQFKRIISFLFLACVTLTTFAKDDIDSLYTKLLSKPETKAANILIKKLYDNGQADSLFVFKSDSDPRMMLYVSVSMSYYYYDNGNYAKSIKASEHSLSFAKELKDTVLILDNCNQMSASYFCISDYKNATKACLEALPYATNPRDKESLSLLYYNLANANVSLFKYDAARDNIEKAIENYKKTNDTAGMSLAYGLAAEILQKTNETDKAISYIQEAITLAQNTGNGHFIAARRLQAVEIYLQQKNYKKAEEESTKALEYFDNNDISIETIVCYRQMGEIQSLLRNHDKATTYLKKAEELCLKSNNIHLLVKIYEAMAENERSSNLSLAYDYRLKVDSVKEKIFNQETNRMVNDLQILYETELKQNTIEKQNVELKNRQLLLVAGGITAALIIIIIILFFVGRNARKNKIHAAQLKVERDEATKARDEAVKANKLKDIFLENVVHELRTPINAIQGFNQLLSDEDYPPSDEERGEYMGYITDNCDLLITLVQDTLDVSRLESGNFPVNISEFSAKEACEKSIDKEKNRLQPGVELRIADSAEDFKISSDRVLVERVICNYVSNACKYTSEGSITLDFAKSDDGWEISVTDTGCGIAPENAEKIFNKFEKLGSYIQGNGMGLNIVSLIAKHINARAYLDTSHEAQGCRFVLEVKNV